MHHICPVTLRNKMTSTTSPATLDCSLRSCICPCHSSQLCVTLCHAPRPATSSSHHCRDRKSCAHTRARGRSKLINNVIHSSGEMYAQPASYQVLPRKASMLTRSHRSWLRLRTETDKQDICNSVYIPGSHRLRLGLPRRSNDNDFIRQSIS